MRTVTTAATTSFLVRGLLALAVAAVVVLPGAPAQAAPAAPTALQLVGGARSIGVEFLPPPGGDAFSYSVRVGRGSWQPLYVTDTDGPTLFGRVHDLPGRQAFRDGATYRVSVVAVSRGRYGAVSASRSVTTLRRPAAETVTAQAGDGAVSLVLPSAPGGAGPSGRHVEVVRADDPDGESRELDCLERTCTVDDLGNGVAYRVTVTPYRSVVLRSGEERSLGPARAVTVVPSGVRGEPLVVSVVPLDGRVRLGWTAPQGGPGAGGEEATYEVLVDDGAWQPVTATLDGSTWTSVVEGLDNGFPTQLRVRAVVGEVAGPASRPRTAVPAGRPGAVREPVATPGSRSARVTWDDPDDDGGSVLTRYVVTDASGRTVCGAVPVAAASCVVRRLPARSTQVFTVRAVNTAAGKPDTGTGPGVATAPVRVRR